MINKEKLIHEIKVPNSDIVVRITTISGIPVTNNRYQDFSVYCLDVWGVGVFYISESVIDKKWRYRVYAGSSMSNAIGLDSAQEAHDAAVRSLIESTEESVNEMYLRGHWGV
ncbi:hypothetical protein N9137_03240 [Pseudomonadales bacterium]|nr:hypothetical protein [Pseudomonadales bacterium]